MPQDGSASEPEAYHPPRAIDEEYRMSEPEAFVPARSFSEAAEKSSPEPLFPDDDKFRFTLADLMILTFGISLGMAGGTWIHPGLFSLLLGVIMLGGLAIYHIDPPETHRMKVAWATLLAGYISSVIAAMIKYSPLFSE